jgi:bla regulator protein blaR1
MPIIRRFASLFLGLLACLHAPAQAPAEPTYGYEVVSVKKSDPAARGIRIGPGPQGGLRSSNTTLMVLLTFAYDVRDYQILEAPGWSKNEGFDVSFTPEKPETPLKPGEADAKSMETMMHRQRQRMQAVLRDRFGAKLRMETRDLPIYSLTIAKSGSKLKEPEAGGKGPGMMMNGDKGELTGVGANMRMLTNVLSNILKRPVVDETGIDSTFDMKLQWKPDSFVGGPDAPSAGEAPVADVEGASIFTAITEQLGLRLVSKKGPVTVYVVEKAERPSEN